MANLTVQELQNIAVKAATEFLNNEHSLNESLAKQASEYNLNSEQLKRAVEATNTLTHLKTLELSSDKTAEFPVADYKTILKMASLPETDPEEGEESGFGFFDKTAYEIGNDVVAAALEVEIKLNPEQAKAHLLKFASASERQVELLKGDLEVYSAKFMQKVAQLRNDAQAHEHLSASSATDSEYNLLSRAVFGEEKVRCNFVDGMFKSASLKPVEELLNLVKEAKCIRDQLHAEEKVQDRAKAKLRELTKQAGLESAVFKLGRTATRAVTYVPRKIGATIGSGAKAVGELGAKTLNNAVADTGLGKRVGIKPMAVDPNLRKRVNRIPAVAGFAAGAIADTAMFHPKVDPANDRSGDVWGALQS